MSFWEVFVAIFWFMLLVAWFWLLITILTDVFRDKELSGWAKGGWCIFLIVLPWVGVLTYLVARGRGMNERAAREQAAREESYKQYVRSVAQESGTGGTSTADELRKLADLRDRGSLSSEDYEAAKAQVLGRASAPAMSDKIPPQPTGTP